MAKDHWIVTRPKRKLILVPELIKIFSATVEGKKWYRNRTIQIQFEKALTEAGWKAQNISADGSGGRTYAVLLYMLGLWYGKDEVQITNAGKEIIDGGNTVAILTKQLLDFQYPSPYSIKQNVDVSRDIHIQPYRFILRLLLETELDEINQDEIAFCLVPYAKTKNDIEKCVDIIGNYRLNEKKYQIEAIQATRRDATYLKNIGNTIVNQLEYSGYFIEDDNIKSLSLKPDKKQAAIAFLSERRTTLLQNPEDEALYQRRYGSGLDKTKDYRKSIRKPMEISPNKRRVLEEFYIIAAKKPVFSVDDELIEAIRISIGAPTKLIRETLKSLPLNIMGGEFEDTYLRLASGGNKTAKDFERKTTSLLKDGFGLNAEWVGKYPRFPDVIVFVNDDEKKHGIIDTKAYSSYNLPIDQRNKMAVNYLHDFELYNFQEKEYKLAFFGYIAGNYGANIQNAFDELLGMSDYPGSYITARDLLNLYQMHKETKFTASEFIDIFTCNKQINPNEIRRQ